MTVTVLPLPSRVREGKYVLLAISMSVELLSPSERLTSSTEHEEEKSQHPERQSLPPFPAVPEAPPLQK
jgi:hypothetical protein